MDSERGVDKVVLAHVADRLESLELLAHVAEFEVRVALGVFRRRLFCFFAFAIIILVCHK